MEPKDAIQCMYNRFKELLFRADTKDFDEGDGAVLEGVSKFLTDRTEQRPIFDPHKPPEEKDEIVLPRGSRWVYHDLGHGIMVSAFDTEGTCVGISWMPGLRLKKQK